MDYHRITYCRQCTIQLLVWPLLWAISINCVAHNTYRTDLLKSIAVKCNLQQQLDTLSEGEHFQFSYYKNQHITAIVNNKRITHIGYSIFSRTQREGIGIEVCNFLERYFLELDIPTCEYLSREQRMLEDRVKILKGDFNLKKLYEINRDTTTYLNIQILNSREYLMGWRRDSTWLYIISFPIEYDLLFGTNMDESERRLPEELLLMPFVQDSLKVDKFTKIRKAWQDNYYTVEGESYLLPNLRSDLYLKKDSDGHFKPIYDKLYPIESLSNLLTSNLVNNDYVLEIKYVKYGLKSDTLTIPLMTWINYCQQTGCKIFLGIISMEKDSDASCELIIHNSNMGYNHIMKLFFPIRNFEERKGVIKARLNSYVNYTRIKNLFAD